MPDIDDSHAALIEAEEEAGVVGSVAKDPVGNFSYVKKKKDGRRIPVDVDLYVVWVSETLQTWPECHKRRRVWEPIEAAERKLSDSGLRQILSSICEVGCGAKPSIIDAHGPRRANESNNQRLSHEHLINYTQPTSAPA